MNRSVARSVVGVHGDEAIERPGRSHSLTSPADGVVDLGPRGWPFRVAGQRRRGWRGKLARPAPGPCRRHFSIRRVNSSSRNSPPKNQGYRRRDHVPCGAEAASPAARRGPRSPAWQRPRSRPVARDGQKSADPRPSSRAQRCGSCQPCHPDRESQAGDQPAPSSDDKERREGPQKPDHAQHPTWRRGRASEPVRIPRRAPIQAHRAIAPTSGPARAAQASPLTFGPPTVSTAEPALRRRALCTASARGDVQVPGHTPQAALQQHEAELSAGRPGEGDLMLTRVSITSEASTADRPRRSPAALPPPASCR